MKPDFSISIWLHGQKIERKKIGIKNLQKFAIIPAFYGENEFNA